MYVAEHCGGVSRTCCMQPSMAWFLAHVTAGAALDLHQMRIAGQEED
jgi:hypothetical protein